MSDDVIHFVRATQNDPATLMNIRRLQRHDPLLAAVCNPTRKRLAARLLDEHRHRVRRIH